MMRAPPSSTARASCIATPLGVAKNTTSQLANALALGSLKARSTRRRRLGNIAATGVPASLREVMTFNSACGCCASRRSNSTPVYPVPPTMPILITAVRLQKRESRPEAAFDSQKQASVSTFRVLLAPPRLMQAHLLSLHFARIARHQAGRTQPRLQCCIILDERARNPVANRARLAAFSAAVDVHADVEAGKVLGELERLAHHHPARLAAEELVDRLAVHHELALAWLEEYASDGALAPARAVVIVADHSMFP